MNINPICIYSILNIWNAHKSAVVEGDILKSCQIVCGQGVVVNESKKIQYEVLQYQTEIRMYIGYLTCLVN